DTLSGCRRFGAVVSVTVRYQSPSRWMFVVQPYTAAGRTRPMATTTSQPIMAPGPWVSSNHGNMTIAYGFTNTAAPASAPASRGYRDTSTIDGSSSTPSSAFVWPSDSSRIRNFARISNVHPARTANRVLDCGSSSSNALRNNAIHPNDKANQTFL